MCTLTWRVAETGGYDLFFNRDERNTRAPERPPQRGCTDAGVGYVAPEDGDHHGTWIVLNAHGVTVCLLNYYPRGLVEVGRKSRGQLPLACASCARADEVPSVLRGVELACFAPFHLVAVDAAGGAIHLRWDGRALHEAPAPEFLTSSSFEPERVQTERAAQFARWPGRSSETLLSFHQQHHSETGAKSVCMQRADACTRSICAVRVRPDFREICYQPVKWGGEAVTAPLLMRL